VTAFGYDTLGRMTAVTNALGYVTSYGYDELGQQVSQTDANQHTTTFEYDANGRRVKRTLPGNQVETYAYNVGGLLTNKTDFNGFSTTYQYDGMNRLVAKLPSTTLYPQSTPVTYAYDTLGLRTNMTDASGTTAYRYDDGHRLVQKTKAWGGTLSVTLSYGYDVLGNLTNIVSSTPNGVKVTYGYDALNRLSTVDDAATGRTAYGYDEVGNLQGSVYPNLVHTEYQYDALNRLTNLAAAQALTPLANYAYTVGAAGNRLSASEQLFASALNPQTRTINRVYSYDDLYRLTGETINGTATVGAASYGYDPVGNRQSRSVASLPLLPQIFTFDANDRLKTDSYDANGNTLYGAGFGQTQPDQYDFENHLVRRTATINHQLSTIDIVYDGDGNRVRKTVSTATNTVTTFYVVDELNPSGYAQVLEEHVARNGQAPVLDCVYTYGHNLISQTRRDGGLWATSFYGYDGHNNVRYLTDGNGAVTDTYDYDAFGNLTAASGVTVNCYLFTGEQLDVDLGLYYLRARYHNLDTGRFWNMDSYEGDNSDPASLHKYNYCGNNPVNAYDPSGHMSLGEFMVGTAIGNMVGGALLQAYGGAIGRMIGTLNGGGSWSEAGNAALTGVGDDALNGAEGGLIGFGIGKGVGWVIGKVPGMCNTLVQFARKSELLDNAYKSLADDISKLTGAIVLGSESLLKSAAEAVFQARVAIAMLTERVNSLASWLGIQSAFHVGGAAARDCVALVAETLANALGVSCNTGVLRDYIKTGNVTSLSNAIEWITSATRLKTFESGPCGDPNLSPGFYALYTPTSKGGHVVFGQILSNGERLIIDGQVSANEGGVLQNGATAIWNRATAIRFDRAPR